MNTKQFSTIQEKSIADALRWSTISGSGARLTSIGDVEGNNWLGECKTHMKAGSKISFSSAVWVKILDQASVKFKFPVLFVDDGSRDLKRTWCMIPWYTLPAASQISVQQIDSRWNHDASVSFKHDDGVHQLDRLDPMKFRAFIVPGTYPTAITTFSTFKEYLVENRYT